jgi:TM2 domain-containing membrane protein YozV
MYVALWSQKNIRAMVLPLCYSILELIGILVLIRLIDIFVVATKDSSYFTQLISILYSKTCLNRTSLGLKYLFSLDSYLVYTGSNHIDI